MGSFKDYYDENIGQFVKGVFNSEYRALPPKLKSYYDMMTPQAREELHNLRNARQIPLSQALQIYISETGVRTQWRSMQRNMPAERDPGHVTPWGQDSVGWKRF